ncbi:MAG: ribonuclease P protein component [Thermodesulfobacteriota bacterium]
MRGGGAAAAMECVTSEGLSKTRRLLRRRDFQTTLKQGRIVRCGGVLMAAKRNPFDFSRLGIAVGKAVANAVVRNRFKRCVREAFRRRADVRTAGLDIVVVLKSQQIHHGLSSIVNDLFGELLRVPRI